jgi:hypothetical protein
VSKKRKSGRGRDRSNSARRETAAKETTEKAFSAEGRTGAVAVDDHSNAVAEVPPPGARLWSRSEVLKGAAITVVGGLVLGGVVWAVKQVVDVPAVGDGLRGAVRDDIRYTVEVIYLDDEGRSKALPSAFQPDADLMALMAKPGSAADPALDNRLRSLGAAHVGALSLRLTVEGRLNQEIRVLDIRPMLVGQRSAPLDGTLFYIPPQEADPVMNMIFDMDALSPQARAVDEEGRIAEPFFEKNTISLPEGEQDTIVIRTYSKKFSVAFFVRMQYQIGGEVRHVDIYDHGKPFRLTAMSCDRDRKTRYRRAYALNGDFSLRAESDPSALECVAGYKQF